MGERDWEEVLEAIPKMVDDEGNKELIKDVEEREIIQAVFEMGALKALGPNGFNGYFYQKY